VPKALKILRKLSKKRHFGSFFVVFWGPGPVLEPCWNRSGKKTFKTVDYLRNWRSFWSFSSIFWKRFFSAFYDTFLFSTLSGFGGPKVAKWEVLGDHFEALWVVGLTCENRRFTCTAAQFRGLRRVWKSSLFETFFGRGKKWFPGRHFCGFF